MYNYWEVKKRHKNGRKSKADTWKRVGSVTELAGNCV